MGVRPAIFDLLLRASAPEADDALGLALQAADEATTAHIVDVLLARDQTTGLQALVANLHRLTDPVRQRVLDATSRVFRVLRSSFQSPDEQVRLNVVQIIVAGRAFRAAYLLDTALHDRSPGVRDAAAESINALAYALLERPESQCGMDPNSTPEAFASETEKNESYREDRRQVIAAIEPGMASFSLHLRPRILEAALWFADEMSPGFWALISGGTSRASHALASILQRPLSPRLVPFCATACAHSKIRQQISKPLASCSDPAFWAEWFAQGWRIAEPRTARSMELIKEIACLKEHAAALLELPRESLRHAPHAIAATGTPLEARISALRELYRRGDDVMRRSVTAALTSLEDEKAADILRIIEREADPRLADVARYELARRYPSEYPPKELLRRLVAGATPVAAERPREEISDFDRYWAGFERLTTDEQARIGKYLLAKQPTARNMLVHHLGAGDAPGRVRAIRVITVVGCTEDYAEELYRLSHDSSAEVRSAAIAALGSVSGATTRLILRGALADPDLRVQANAVEAVEHAGSSTASDLLPKLASTDNRVRANAVKALLRMGVRDAAETLLLMLKDPSRSHRISGLWLIENMGLFPLGARIVAMSESDEDPAVRTRARQLTDRLRSPQAATEVAGAGVNP